MFAFCQILDTAIRYFEDGKHPNFYHKIVLYSLFTMIYLKLWGILWVFSFTDVLADFIYAYAIVILYIISFPIVLYNYKIMNQKYPVLPKNVSDD